MSTPNEPQQPAWTPPPPPPPGWAPAPIQSSSHGLHHGITTTTGSTTKQPLTPEPSAEASVSVEDFAPPRPKAPWLIGLGLLLIGSLIAWLAIGQPQNVLPNLVPTPKPTPTLTQPAWGMPFTDQAGKDSGHWEIIESEWSDLGLDVNVRVAVDSGVMTFGFHAFQNSTAEIIYSGSSHKTPEFIFAPMAAGDVRSGWIHFDMRRDMSTVILTDWFGQQLSGLQVEG